MKKLILLIAIVSFIDLAHAQTMRGKDVPAAVSDTFAKAYPTLDDVNWIKDGNNYVVNYTEHKLNKSVTLDASGDLIGTREEIIISSLPIALMVYVKNNYRNNIVSEASKNTDAQGTVTYNTEISGMNLYFDAEGNFLKSVAN